VIPSDRFLRFDLGHLIAPSIPPIILGWQERVSLPNFGGESFVAKIDSGALSSCLHAVDIRTRWTGDALRVSFRTSHPRGLSNNHRRYSARIIDQIMVRSSNGTFQQRHVIETQLKIGDQLQLIRLSLSDRSSMQFALLIGRDAIEGRYLIDCSRSFLAGEENLEQF
jgi:hypothetical protein